MFLKSMKLILLVSIGAVGAILSISSALAARQPISPSPPAPIEDECQSRQSMPLEAQVLIEIHRALLHQSISPEEEAVLERDALDSPHDCLYLKGLSARVERYERRSLPCAGRGTISFQDQILAKIGDALEEASISPKQAARLQTAVNKISAEEAFYFSKYDAIPLTLLNRDNFKLTTMSRELDRRMIGAKPGVPITH